MLVGRSRTLCVSVKTTSLQKALKEGGIMSEKKSGRELIDTGNDKRYVRRDDKGRFDEVVDVGRSLAQDRRQHSSNVVPSVYLDRLFVFFGKFV